MKELRPRNEINVVCCSLVLIFLLIITPIAVILFIPQGTGSKSTFVMVSGDGQDDFFGWNVSGAGDINNDGFDDIIVGAPGYDNERGRAYIFFGGPWFSGTFSAGDANMTITGTSLGDRFGWDVSKAGNMNNDAFDDIIIGAPGYNSNSGAAYIFFGNNSFPLFMDATDANIMMVSGNADDEFSSSVSDAGDVNNDGYDDVIVGSSGNNSDTGSAHIYYGAQFIPETIDVKNANVSMFGENIGDKFGFSVSCAGDVNDDNYDDVIIGAPGVDQVYIYYGAEHMNSWFQSIQAEFDLGTKVHVKTEAIGDGEVKLETFNNIKAMMAYYNGSDIYTPRIRTWDQTIWGSWGNANSAGIDDNYWFVIKSGTVRKNEKVLAVSDNTSDINVQVSDGLSWGSVLELADVSANSDYRGFDLAYESLSGDVLLTYYNVSSGNKFPKFRIWDGNSWSAEQDALGVGTVDIYWIVLASNPNSDEILMVTLDSNNEIWAQVWDGNAWGNNQSIETSASQTAYQCFDVVYESQSGYGFIAWSANFIDLKYRRWKGDWSESEGIWGPAIDEVRFIKLASEPNTNYILAAQLNVLPQMAARVWDGSSWGTEVELTTGFSDTDRRGFNVAWEHKSDREGLIVYRNTTEAPCYRTVFGSVINDTELTTIDANPGPGDPNWIVLVSDPQTDNIVLMYLVNDGFGTVDDIGVEIWGGNAWGYEQNVETDSTRDNAQRFDFTYTDTSGYLISTPHDAGSITSWGRIIWNADVPIGTTLKIRTRTSPDGSNWNPWSDWYNNGDRITSLTNRWIQYQAFLETSNVTLTPILHDVNIELNRANLIIRGTLGENFGWSVSDAGNLDNDNYDDIIIGAPQNSSAKGSAYIFHGGYILDESNGDSYINLTEGETANITLIGESSGDLFGYSVCSAGTFNNDGYTDIVIGAPEAFGNGSIYFFFGGPLMSSIIPASNNDFSLLGEKSFDGFGWSVSGAGNVDNDPYFHHEVIAGSPYFDEGVNPDLGKVYVIHLYYQPDLWINGNGDNIYQDAPGGVQENLSEITPGNNATWWIRLQNDGELNDTFNFNITSNILSSWTCEIRDNATWDIVNNDDNIGLSIGESRDYIINISSPISTINNDESWVTVTIDSRNDSSKKDSIKAIARAVDITPPFLCDTTTGLPTTGDSFIITANISDNTVIDKVYLNYWFNTTGAPTTVQKVTMNDLGNGNYDYMIVDVPLAALVLHYNISANDTSCNWNETCEKILSVEDNDLPMIIDISANPSTQVVDGQVNITVNVVDNIAINEVWVEITYPGGSKINNSMKKAGGSNWYYSNFYTELGDYNYTLWINDTNDNLKASTLHQFQIIPSVDHIQIRTLPGGNGEVVNLMIINVDDTVKIYASAYNDDIGYLGDVEVNWFSTNPYAGTVNPSTGSSTNLTGIALGTGDLYATFGILNHKATFEVVISQEPVINGTIPNIELYEDFGIYSIPLSKYASDPQDKLSDLRWRLTGIDTSVLITNNETKYGVHDIPIIAQKDKYGNMEVTYWLVDRQGNEVSQKAWINVSPRNDPPVIADCPNLIVHFDKSYIFDYSPYISDVDNSLSELILTVDKTEYATVNGFILTYNYPKSMLGSKDYVTLKVSDGVSNGSDLIEISVTSNNPPVIIGRIPDLTLYENETRLAVFNLSNYFTDPDGDTLSMTYFNGQVEISINADNTVDFSASGEWSGTERVTFRAKDPMGAMVEQTINVTVLGINDPPEIKPIPELHVHFNRSWSFDLRWYISDQDNETEELTIFTSNPDNVSVMGTRIILLYPEYWEGQRYPYTVPLWINVSDGISVSSQYTIVRVDDNFPPEMFLSLADLFIFEDQKLIGIYDLDSYFYDLDDDPIFYTYGNVYINVTIHEDHTIDFVPPPDWFGSELIVIRATDDKGAFFEDMIRVTVFPVNDPPTIADIPEQVGIRGQEWILDLTDYIFDIDNPLGNLSVSVNSTCVNVVGHVLIFRYPENIKEDTIWITVSDGINETTASVHVIIKPPPSAPAEIPLLLILPFILGAILAVILVLRRGIYSVEDLFLITRSGLLIEHAGLKMNYEGGEEKDQDILAGMFVAVQEFIRDSFGREEGEDLKRLDYGEKKVLVHRGNFVLLAAFLSGPVIKPFDRKMKDFVEEIEELFADELENWTGNIEAFPDIKTVLESLLEGKYARGYLEKQKKLNQKNNN